MSGGVVFRRALSILAEYDLPEVATSDVLAVLEHNRPGLLDFSYDASMEAKVPREVALDRCAAKT